MQNFEIKNDVELTGVDPIFYKTNREAFFENLPKIFPEVEKQSLIILEGGQEVPRYDTDVNYFHFQQEDNFFYLTGVIEPDFFLFIDIDKKESILYFKVPPEHTKTWQYVPSTEELNKKYGLEVRSFEDFYKDINAFNPNKIYLLEGVNTDSDLKVISAKLNFPEEFKALNDKISKEPLVYEALADARTRKSKYEIELLKFCSKITVEAHIEVMKTLKAGLIERDLENTHIGYLSEKYYTRFYGYNCICCSGLNSSTLHYINNDKPVNAGDIFLFDNGVKVRGYVADVSSTVPVDGKFTQKQKEIYDIVLNANRTVISLLKEGVSWLDMHIEAEKIILQGLIKLGLIHSGYELSELLEKRISYYFFPHGLGHFLGLGVHDVGGYLSFNPKRSEKIGYKSLRTSRVLQENNVITVEPGIYFIPFLLEKAFSDDSIKKYFNEEKVRTYFGFGGIRIEDDVLILKDGCINLTGDIPRTTEEIEKIMNKN